MIIIGILLILFGIPVIGDYIKNLKDNKNLDIDLPMGEAFYTTAVIIYLIVILCKFVKI
jgi:hypothetical protein